MKFSLFASKPKSKSLKLCPWNTKQKTAFPDPPEVKWLIRVARLVAVRHVAGSVAHEAHWPNPVPLLVPIFTPDPSLCLESCLLPPAHSFLNCFTWNSIVAEGIWDSWLKVFIFFWVFLFFFNLLFIWFCCPHAPPSPPPPLPHLGAQFSSLLYCSEVLFDPWMSFFFPPFFLFLVLTQDELRNLQSPLFKNEEFRDGDCRALNQAWGYSQPVS